MSVAQLMLQHGKHVLCELPMGINAKQVRTLTECAKEKHLFLAEGIFSRYFPGTRYVEQQIQNGKLGEINSVDVNFALKLTEWDRLM